MPKLVTLWQCKWEGCGFVGGPASKVEQHEECCLFNPANRSCHTCGNALKRFECTYSLYLITDCSAWQPKAEGDAEC